jgi:CAAX protease family protein
MKSEPKLLERLHLGTSDEMIYWLPMGIFLLCVWAGNHWMFLYPYFYVARAVIVAILLWFFWWRYTPVHWTHLKLGFFMGVIGTVQWIAMQRWLQAHVEFFRPGDFFNPETAIASPALRYLFFMVRIASAVLVVPVMEELFWRDYVWRVILAPTDFKLAHIGEWHWLPFIMVAAAFATVHGNWVLTAFVWGLMIGWLLVRTKSLGACIIMHATTNLLLASYILWTKNWSFW